VLLLLPLLLLVVAVQAGKIMPAEQPLLQGLLSAAALLAGAAAGSSVTSKSK
jgi:hypothetical protein